ncbi:MAG: cbb3-type cytochrome oxidase assembly protein CcoS [Bacillota bacterium]
MWVIAVLMFFSLLVAGGFLFAFIWAVRSGQYDDKYTPSVRILFDDQKKTDSKTGNNVNGKNKTGNIKTDNNKTDNNKPENLNK